MDKQTKQIKRINKQTKNERINKQTKNERINKQKELNG